MQKNTQCVHSGSRVDPSTGGLNTPIYPSSAFKYMDMHENTYPRYYNTPNQKTVVEKLCALECHYKEIFQDIDTEDDYSKVQ